MSTFLRHVSAVAIGILVLVGSAQAQASGASAVTVELSDKDKAQYFSNARAALEQKNPREAIEQLEKIVGAYEKAYGAHPEVVVRTARSTEESLIYLAFAAASEVKDEGKDKSSEISINMPADSNGAMLGQTGNTVVLDPSWSDAYLLQAYALVELGHLDSARTMLNKALRLGPNNAHYLIEMGYVYQAQRNWDKSMEYYRQAAEAAEAYSPDETKKDDLARAWRGEGFSLIELGKLDEATELYKKCLKLDKNDAKAQQELAYINQLRKKKK